MSDIYILTKNRALMFLLFRLLIQDLKPHMVGAFEDFGRQTSSQGQGNLLIFEIRSATNPHLLGGVLH